jgi:hypothetical protein
MGIFRFSSVNSTNFANVVQFRQKIEHQKDFKTILDLELNKIYRNNLKFVN